MNNFVNNSVLIFKYIFKNKEEDEWNSTRLDLTADSILSFYRQLEKRALKKKTGHNTSSTQNTSEDTS